MQNERQPLGLTKPVQGRALRLIQALITAAEAAGHTCSAGQTGFAPPSHRRRRAHPHFTITAQGQTVGFLVLQEQDRAEHVANEKELADAKKHSWVRIPRFDYTPSERFRFIISGGQPHRASEWADTPGRPLDEQLAEIAQEVTLRGEAVERRRRDEAEAARQKRIRWEAAMEQAEVPPANHHQTQKTTIGHRSDPSNSIHRSRAPRSRSQHHTHHHNTNTAPEHATKQPTAQAPPPETPASPPPDAKHQ
ncbi:hypothetical protein [Streptomyces sp. NPDC091219]|uniref:hypothetical protein n=1 Tax=Streptomyces sp. NPDC091219 TaxID=3155193 RepID=UPI00344E2C24